MPNQYAAEHKVWLWGFIKHIGPYMAVLGGVIVALVEADWIDTPARSQEIGAVQRAVDSQGEKIEELADVQQEMRDQAIRQTEQIKSINKSIGNVENSIDALTRSLLGNRADRMKFESGDPPL